MKHRPLTFEALLSTHDNASLQGPVEQVFSNPKPQILFPIHP